MLLLKDEYNVDATYEGMDICSVRWIAGGSDVLRFLERYASDIATDIVGDKVYLVSSMWRLEHVQELFPNLELRTIKEHQ
jgi:peptide subunit release factor RF-3